MATTRAPHLRFTRYQRDVSVPGPHPYDNGIRLAQVFDYSISPKTQLSGTRDIVWGNNAPLSYVMSSAYLPSIRDGDSTTPHDLAWYKANHPDWIVWGTDQATPSEYLHYANKFLVDLDIRNAAVRSYKLAECVAQQALGFNAIAFDNVGLKNDGYVPRGGVWTGSTYDGSGNRSGGTFSTRYAGVSDDSVWRSDLIDYITWLRGQLNARGMALIGNVTLGTGTAAQIADSKTLLRNVDIALFESYIWSSGAGPFPTNASWAAMYDIITDHILRGGAAIFAMYDGNNGPAQMANEAAAWIVSNVLLMKNARSSLHFGPYGSLNTYPASWTSAVGYPIEAPSLVGSVYQRRYSNGFVAVNPSSTVSASYTVPAGTWADQFGNAVASGAQTLAAKSGIVLVGG